MEETLSETNPYAGLAFLVDTLNAIQKIRQSTGNRVTHLSKRGKRDEVAERYHELMQGVEDDLVKDIEPLIVTHPTWKWASRVKGVGKENLAKVVGLIERVENDSTHGVECFATPSKLVRFSGVAVIDGKAERRVVGEKLHYCSELRVMLWRLGGNLLKAEGKFYNYYLGEKAYLEARYKSEGKSILPTPKGKYCPKCAKVVNIKKGKYCPDCRTALMKKVEPPNVIFEGHLHASALRRTIRMFVIMLDTAWREELGLPTRDPYPVEHLGHTQILTPLDFVDDKKQKSE